MLRVWYFSDSDKRRTLSGFHAARKNAWQRSRWSFLRRSSRLQVPELLRRQRHSEPRRCLRSDSHGGDVASACRGCWRRVHYVSQVVVSHTNCYCNRRRASECLHRPMLLCFVFLCVCVDNSGECVFVCLCVCVCVVCVVVLQYRFCPTLKRTMKWRKVVMVWFNSLLLLLFCKHCAALYEVVRRKRIWIDWNRHLSN